MSVHPSLKSTDKNKKQRSVLKRTERIKKMIDKDEWKEGDSVFGLPKIKTVKLKLKKEKVEKPEEAGAAAEGTAPTAETKEQASGKGAADKKPQEKKAQGKK
ncbi:MAG: small basic protein [Candidatus Omnitrophica bacterium]|nr:small basic protein [Candidatus Omnitrophota bacterium]